MLSNNSTQSSQVVPFFFQDHKIRVLTDEIGEVWFVAKDVCDALGNGNPSQAIKSSGLDDSEKSHFKLGYRESVIVNESGLYSLIFNSRKPETKPFKKWVTSEVLPEIRKTGSYDFKKHLKTNVKDELYVLKEVTKMLRLPESAVQNGIAAILQKFGLEQTYLPNYSKSEFKKAMGDLLKDHCSDLSTQRVNPILIKLGILEEIERRASKGETKKFKSITKKGLEYGENEQSRQNTKETHPRWYVHKFHELLDLIHDNIDINKVEHLEVVQ